MRALELLKMGAAQEKKDPNTKKPYYVLTSTKEAYWSLEEVLQAHINDTGGSEVFGLGAPEIRLCAGAASQHSTAARTAQNSTRTNTRQIASHRSNGKSRAESRNSTGIAGRNSESGTPRERREEGVPHEVADFVEVSV
jgi:hypothetical protein